MATLYKKIGAFNNASDLFRKCLEVFQSKEESEDKVHTYILEIASCMNQFGSVLRELKQFEESE